MQAVVVVLSIFQELLVVVELAVEDVVLLMYLVVHNQLQMQQEMQTLEVEQVAVL
jgi:hypothetical protein